MAYYGIRYNWFISLCVDVVSGNYRSSSTTSAVRLRRTVTISFSPFLKCTFSCFTGCHSGMILLSIVTGS